MKHINLTILSLLFIIILGACSIAVFIPDEVKNAINPSSSDDGNDNDTSEPTTHYVDVEKVNAQLSSSHFSSFLINKSSLYKNNTKILGFSIYDNATGEEYNITHTGLSTMFSIELTDNKITLYMKKNDKDYLANYKIKWLLELVATDDYSSDIEEYSIIVSKNTYSKNFNFRAIKISDNTNVSQVVTFEIKEYPDYYYPIRISSILATSLNEYDRGVRFSTTNEWGLNCDSAGRNWHSPLFFNHENRVPNLGWDYCGQDVDRLSMGSILTPNTDLQNQYADLHKYKADHKFIPDYDLQKDEIYYLYPLRSKLDISFTQEIDIDNSDVSDYFNYIVSSDKKSVTLTPVFGNTKENAHNTNKFLLIKNSVTNTSKKIYFVFQDIDKTKYPESLLNLQDFPAAPFITPYGFYNSFSNGNITFPEVNTNNIPFFWTSDSGESHNNFMFNYSDYITPVYSVSNEFIFNDTTFTKTKELFSAEHLHNLIKNKLKYLYGDTITNDLFFVEHFQLEKFRVYMYIYWGVNNNAIRSGVEFGYSRGPSDVIHFENKTFLGSTKKYVLLPYYHSHTFNYFVAASRNWVNDVWVTGRLGSGTSGNYFTNHPDYSRNNFYGKHFNSVYFTYY